MNCDSFILWLGGHRPIGAATITSGGVVSMTLTTASQLPLSEKVAVADFVIENEQAKAKAAARVAAGKKKSKAQLKKAPEGTVVWTEQTYDKLVAGEPERLVSRMRVDNAMLINVASREAVRVTVRSLDEPPGCRSRFQGLRAGGQGRSKEGPPSANSWVPSLPVSSMTVSSMRLSTLTPCEGELNRAP